MLAIPAWPLWDGVEALLTAGPRVDRIERAHDCEAALGQVDALLPTVVVVDGALGGMRAPALVARLKAR